MALLVLQLKAGARCPPIPVSASGGAYNPPARLLSNLQGRPTVQPPSPTAVQLTGSPNREGADLPFTQLTESPIREISF